MNDSNNNHSDNNNPDKSIIGLILAGGQSSRMGQNKASLSYNNTTLLEHIVNLLKQLSLTEIFISGPPLENISINNDQFIIDLINNRGPLSGIYSTLNSLIQKEETKHRYLLIVPVDMPLLSPDLLNQLIDAVDGLECVYFENHSLPLLIKIDQKITSLLKEKLFNSNEASKYSYSIKSFTNKLLSKSLKLPANVQNFININTPEDFQYLNRAKTKLE